MNRTKEEKLKSGMSEYDIAHAERAQKVYDFAHKIVTEEWLPKMDDYAQREYTRKLLLRAAGARNDI